MSVENAVGNFGRRVKAIVSAARSSVTTDRSGIMDLHRVTRDRRSFTRFDKRYVVGIPQAEIIEEGLESFEKRDWRSYFASKLSGKGLEIGPLHRPMVKHSGMEIDYIDRLSVSDLRKHYPELNDLPLIEPTILGDAQDLANIPDRTYDFVIAAHVIEHMKNPLAALEAWTRVLNPGGKIYLIAPDKRAIFDHKRVRTTLEHVIQDYRMPSPDRDFEHYIDYAVHVHNMSGNAALDEAGRLLEEDYSIHFHTFIPSDVLRLVKWFSNNVRTLNITEGPCMAPKSDEFHFLLQGEQLRG